MVLQTRIAVLQVGGEVTTEVGPVAPLVMMVTQLSLTVADRGSFYLGQLMVSSLVDRLRIDHLLLLEVWVTPIVVMMIVVMRVRSLRELSTAPISLADILLSELTDATRRGLVVTATCSAPSGIGGGVLAAARCPATVRWKEFNHGEPLLLLLKVIVLVRKY